MLLLLLVSMLFSRPYHYYLPIVVASAPQYSVSTWPGTPIGQLRKLEPEYVRINLAYWHQGQYNAWDLASPWMLEVKTLTDQVHESGYKVWLTFQGAPPTRTDGRPCYVLPEYHYLYAAHIVDAASWFQAERIQIQNEPNSPAVHPYFGCNWNPAEYLDLIAQVEALGLPENTELIGPGLVYGHPSPFAEAIAGNPAFTAFDVHLFGQWDGANGWQNWTPLPQVLAYYQSLTPKPWHIGEINLLCAWGETCNTPDFFNTQAAFLALARLQWPYDLNVYAATKCSANNAWQWACLYYPDKSLTPAGLLVQGIYP